MAFDRQKADEAASAIVLAHEKLQLAGLYTLAMVALDFLERLDAVLDNDSPMPGDDE